MNRENEQYPQLMFATVESMADLLKKAYLPFINDAGVRDAAEFELHVCMSFLMRYFIKLSSILEIEQNTVRDVWNEFKGVMDESITQYELAIENVNFAEH